MLDFSLTEEQLAVKKMVRDFVEHEILPNIKEWDEKQHFEKGIYKKLADLGLMGVCIPEQYGGAGMDYNTLAIVCEELERGDTAIRTAVSVHIGLNSLTLLQWGTEEQKLKYLVPQAKGEKLAAFALTEPNAGSDVINMSTTAIRDGDYYILNGSKIWISLADVADHFIVFAYTDKSKKHRGISAFIVERNFSGFSSNSIKGKMGIRAGNTGELFFDNMKVPKENRLGEEGEGFKIAMSALDNGRFSVAAGAVGTMEAVLELSINYAKERKTYGKPIGEHQLIQQKIANMVLAVETARLLVYKAGWMKNQGLRTTKESSMAKWYATEQAFKMATEAVQLFGAYGYTNDFPVERYLRNAKGPVIYEGTSEIHTLLQAEYALGLRTDKPLSKTLPPWPFE